MKTYKKQLGKEKEDLADLIHKRYDLDKKVTFLIIIPS